MTTGHFALAAGSKPNAPTAPLWALMLATYLLDVVFMAFVSAGLESFAPMNPAQPAYGQTIIHAAYSHSLTGALLIAALAGLVAAWRWGRRGGVAIATVTFSHWILDLLVHRPDLPLLPGNAGHLPLLGLGLWAHPALSAALELVLVLTGATIYLRGAVRRAGSDAGARRRAIAAAAVTAALLALLLAADALAWPMTLAMTLMLALVAVPGWLDARIERRRPGARRVRRRAAATPAGGPR